MTPDAVIALELAPGAAVTKDAIWVPQRQAAGIIRLDPKDGTLGTPIPLSHAPCASIVSAFRAPQTTGTPMSMQGDAARPAAGEPSPHAPGNASPPRSSAVSSPALANASPAAPAAENLWVPVCEAGSIARIDTVHRTVSATVPLRVAQPDGSIAVAAESVWAVTEAKGVVTRIDPAGNAPIAEAYVAANPFGLAAADAVVWVTSEEGNLLTRIDANTNVVVETVTVGPRPGRIVIGEGAVWTLNRGDGSVSRVDPKSNKVVATIAVGEWMTAGDIAVGEGAVWLSARGTPVVRIDARTNRVTHRFTGEGGGAIIVGHGAVWVAAGVKQTWRVDPALIAALRP